MDARREFSAFTSCSVDVKLHDNREHYVFPILSKCVRIEMKARTRLPYRDEGLSTWASLR